MSTPNQISALFLISPILIRILVKDPLDKITESCGTRMLLSIEVSDTVKTIGVEID